MVSRNAYRLFVGIDVAAASFTAAWSPDCTNLPHATTFEQTSAGYNALIACLRAVKFRPWVYHPLSAMLYQVFAAMLYHDLSAMPYHL